METRPSPANRITSTPGTLSTSAIADRMAVTVLSDSRSKSRYCIPSLRPTRASSQPASKRAAKTASLSRSGLSTINVKWCDFIVRCLMSICVDIGAACDECLVLSMARPSRQPHQPAHPVAADRHRLQRQVARHLAAAVERVGQLQRVDAAHQRQGLGAVTVRRVVERRTAHREQRALPANAQTLVTLIDHRASLVAAQRPSPRAKKSRSTVNSPILACRSWMIDSWSSWRRNPWILPLSGQLRHTSTSLASCENQ